MKTAEEWEQSMPSSHDGYQQTQDDMIATIKRIQLDAMKEGMRRAAEIAARATSGANAKPDTEYERTLSLMNRRTEYITSTILNAAEQLTEKDL